MKKMWKIVAVLGALIMSITFVGCGDNSEDMLSTYYTVTFDANGGEGSMAAQKFIIGEAQSLQANAFTRTDYSFTGWNTKKDGSGTDYADETIVKNLATTNGATVTLYAHWTSNNDTNKDNDYITKYYTVTFNSNNGTPVNPQTVENGTTATEPIAPTLNGYIFDGWYYGDMLFDFSTPITMNITLAAYWTSNNDTNKDNDYITKYYTVTFNSNNGTLVNPQTVENGTTATEPIAPTLDGYIFAGWYYGDMLFDFSTPITMNIMLAAHWTSIDNKDDIPPNENNDNTDNDEKPQYVWLPLEHSYYFNSSNGRGTHKWVYYNNALDYKYIYESQSETQTEQRTVISTTAHTNISTERCSSIESVTTTYIYDSDGNKISDSIDRSETVTTYFEESLPRIFIKSTYSKLTSNDDNVFENNIDYSLEYLGEENDCKVYKYFNNDTSYTIYKIKGGVIQEQNYYYDGKLNSITKCSVPSDEFLAELEFQDSISYDANGNLISTSKYILNSKNENEASIDLVTSSTTYEGVNSYKFKRFTYPF